MNKEPKITLITPPDLFENSSDSIMFIHLADTDQEKVSVWLAENPIKDNLNIYVYDHEIDLNWFFHAVSRCEYVLINLDETNDVTHMLSGYILGKKNCFYKTEDQSKAAVVSYINQNRITEIEKFLVKVFNVKN